MLDTTYGLISRVAKTLNLDENHVAGLTSANQEHIFKIYLKNGQAFPAYRVQHSNKLGPYKGGIRFHPEVSLEEVRALAIMMSLKTAAMGLPLGGGKGGITVDPKSLSSAQLEELSRAYVRHLQPHIGPDKDIPAPDVNTDPVIIDWMVDEYQRLTGDVSTASFTGKSLSAGGSKGRDAATGRGGVIALAKLLQLQGSNGAKLTYAVEGFGNVGSYFAIVAKQQQPGWKLVAASDSSAAVYSTTGLDAKGLANFKSAGGRFVDYKKAGVEIISHSQLLALEVDALVLAALGDSLNSSNYRQVKAKFIVELANGPVSLEALDYLQAKGVVILPDLVANAGGVVVSYLEWLQNKKGQNWPESKVNTSLKIYMVKAVEDLYKTATFYKVPLKEAAFINALKVLTK